VEAVAWFVYEVGKRLGVRLSRGEDFRADRMDWAEVYNLGSYEACQEYIGGLNLSVYPRRGEPSRHGLTGLYSAGRTTTFKVYHKGPEFKKHDSKRLRDFVRRGETVDTERQGNPSSLLKQDELDSLQYQANCILRLETEVKARKLTDDFGAKPLVVQLTRDYLEGVHDREAARLLKESRQEVETVRNNQEVLRRLRGMYDSRLAEALYATWVTLATVGEKEVRRDKPERTWYRQKKQLVDAGVSWNGTNVHISTHSAIPAGFSPVRGNPLRLTEEAEPVRYKLDAFSKIPRPKVGETLEV
jgi:II/X family phage/plasmid replication protein